MKTGFFAYSTYPSNSENCIEEAIERVANSNNKRIVLKSWKNCAINGELVMHNVLHEIDEADYFCADLTGMSNNVLFELGYAITKKKNIFLIFDPSHEKSYYLYKNITCLSTLSYSRYSNSDDIFDLLDARLSGRSKKSLPTNIIDRVSPSSSRKALLHLKAQVNTEFSRRISNQVKHSQLPSLEDDRSEIGIPGLIWYIEQLIPIKNEVEHNLG